MKSFSVQASIAVDSTIPGVPPDNLTPAEELARFENADDAGRFMDRIKSLASIEYFKRPMLSDEHSVGRIMRLLTDANKNLDTPTARLYALWMAEAEAQDDYIKFNDLVQDAIKFRSETNHGGVNESNG